MLIPFIAADGGGSPVDVQLLTLGTSIVVFVIFFILAAETGVLLILCSFSGSIAII